MKTGELVLFPHLRLFVDTIASPQDTALRDFPSDAQLVADIVDNPSMIETYTRKEVRQSAVTDSYEYVIITNSILKNADAGYSFQDLIDFKNAQGVSATIVTVEDIMLNPDYQVTGKWGDANPENPFFNSTITGNIDIFNDKPARIRNFIRYGYTEWGTRSVLLGGDADVAKQSDMIESSLLAKIKEQEIATLHLSDAIICPSHVTRDYIASLGLSRRRVSVIPNGVSPSDFSPSPLPAREGRIPILLYIGTLADWQGLEVVIQALPVILDRRAVRLQIVGRGRSRQRKVLSKQIRKLGLDGIITVQPAVPHHEVPALIADSDICIAPLGLNDRNVTQGACHQGAGIHGFVASPGGIQYADRARARP